MKRSTGLKRCSIFWVWKEDECCFIGKIVFYRLFIKYDDLQVFVYGTLKPGLRYYHVATAGGEFESEEGYVDGFDLYHLMPENYPVAIRGSGQIFGWIYTYSDIERALNYLDQLEGIDEDPPLYERVLTTSNTGMQVWMYLGLDFARYTSSLGASKISSGVWLPEPEP